MSSANAFDQAEYWIKRHKEYKGDSRSVGNLGASVENNLKGEAAYRDIVTKIASVLRKKGMRTVLDLGCGYGRITSCFTNHWFKYKGVDISFDAIAQAKSRHPDANFVVDNLIGYKDSSLFSVVLTLYVMCNFVNDDLWKNFFISAANSIRPNGYLIIADHFPEHERVTSHHVVARPLKEYIPLIESQKFVVDYDIADFVFGNDSSSFKRQFVFLKR